MPDPSEVPVLEPGMKVKWHSKDEWVFDQTWLVVGAHPLYPDIIALVRVGAGTHDDVFWANAADITPVPQMATFSLDLGDGRCGSVEVPVADLERPVWAETPAGRALVCLVRDVVQGKGED